MSQRSQGRLFRTTPHMQFSVYLLEQNAFHMGTVAPHSCPRHVADWMLLRGICRKIGQNAIQLARNISWGEAKSLMPKKSSAADRGKLNKFDYHVPAYTYPLPYHLLRCYERRA